MHWSISWIQHPEIKHERRWLFGFQAHLATVSKYVLSVESTDIGANMWIRLHKKWFRLRGQAYFQDWPYNLAIKLAEAVLTGSVQRTPRSWCRKPKALSTDQVEHQDIAWQTSQRKTHSFYAFWSDICQKSECRWYWIHEMLVFISLTDWWVLSYRLGYFDSQSRHSFF